MAHKTEVIELAQTIRDICRRLELAGKTIKLVPTMGCLHAGHASLIKRAKLADGRTDHSLDHHKTNELTQSTSSGVGGEGDVVVIVSIFVNPKQFNNRDDFLRYPNTFDKDLELCQSLEVDYVFAPKVSEIYRHSTSPGACSQDASCLIKPPKQMADQLEGSSRPGHFEGMLTIVSVLFNLIRPKVAYFGEKDYQQLILVRNMVESLFMDIEVCAVETIRDPDQLPLSSRNSRLNEEQRKIATIMYDLLVNTKEALEWKCRSLDCQHSRDYDDLDCHNLEATILGSIMATQCLNTLLVNDCDNNNDHDGEKCDPVYKLDYLELRCAKHLSSIEYSHDLGAFDCRNGCLKSLKSTNSSSNDHLVLNARLLISVIVAQVRLLDNIEVKLNSHQF